VGRKNSAACRRVLACATPALEHARLADRQSPRASLWSLRAVSKIRSCKVVNQCTDRDERSSLSQMGGHRQAFGINLDGLECHACLRSLVATGFMPTLSRSWTTALGITGALSGEPAPAPGAVSHSSSRPPLHFREAAHTRPNPQSIGSFRERFDLACIGITIRGKGQKVASPAPPTPAPLSRTVWRNRPTS